jgi:hypothetical protein
MPRDKYTPLWRYFRQQPPEVASVTLTIAEPETIVGGPLPSAACEGRGHWWSNAAGVRQTWPWRAVGWRVAAGSAVSCRSPAPQA